MLCSCRHEFMSTERYVDLLSRWHRRFTDGSLDYG